MPLHRIDCTRDIASNLTLSSNNPLMSDLAARSHHDLVDIRRVRIWISRHGLLTSNHSPHCLAAAKVLARTKKQKNPNFLMGNFIVGGKLRQKQKQRFASRASDMDNELIKWLAENDCAECQDKFQSARICSMRTLRLLREQDLHTMGFPLGLFVTLRHALEVLNSTPPPAASPSSSPAPPQPSPPSRPSHPHFANTGEKREAAKAVPPPMAEPRTPATTAPPPPPHPHPQTRAKLSSPPFAPLPHVSIPAHTGHFPAAAGMRKEVSAAADKDSADDTYDATDNYWVAEPSVPRKRSPTDSTESMRVNLPLSGHQNSAPSVPKSLSSTTTTSTTTTTTTSSSKPSTADNAAQEVSPSKRLRKSELEEPRKPLKFSAVRTTDLSPLLHKTEKESCKKHQSPSSQQKKKPKVVFSPSPSRTSDQGKAIPGEDETTYISEQTLPAEHRSMLRQPKAKSQEDLQDEIRELKELKELEEELKDLKELEEQSDEELEEETSIVDSAQGRSVGTLKGGWEKKPEPLPTRRKSVPPNRYGPPEAPTGGVDNVSHERMNRFLEIPPPAPLQLGNYTVDFSFPGHWFNRKYAKDLDAGCHGLSTFCKVLLDSIKNCPHSDFTEEKALALFTTEAKLKTEHDVNIGDRRMIQNIANAHGVELRLDSSFYKQLEGYADSVARGNENVAQVSAMTALHQVGVLLLVSLCSGTILRQVLFDDYSETGAVCLDGSPAGYYIREATSVGAANNWQLDFQGGGWCYEEADCEARSHIYLGTSTVWQSNVSMYASLSDDPAVNPDFYDWNLVWLPYCDGASFSGYLEEPIEYNGTKLYFRGRTILDQVFSHLKRDHNFGNAENVLLTGCSAGGLATFFHADYVQSLLPPSVQIYKSLPMCGFFLDHTNINGKPVYSSQMEYVFQMQNCSAGVNQRCLQAAKEGEEWRCIFAVNNYAHTTIPTFVVNSAVDLWQIG
ncbi:pectin acetylesterase [Pelomyxa schiedti]|nr:pectin acetylesterase [Pelomyxa schiedti]